MINFQVVIFRFSARAQRRVVSVYGGSGGVSPRGHDPYDEPVEALPTIRPLRQPAEGAGTAYRRQRDSTYLLSFFLFAFSFISSFFFFRHMIYNLLIFFIS